MHGGFKEHLTLPVLCFAAYVPSHNLSPVQVGLPYDIGRNFYSLWKYTVTFYYFGHVTPRHFESYFFDLVYFMPSKHHLLTSLARSIGSESAAQEIKWMKQALRNPTVRGTDLFSMVSRRARGEPLQYILGKSVMSI
jgi:hypothetical protein